MYAIVKTGGKQYKVAPGDKLNIEKLNAEPGAKVELEAICVVDGEKVERRSCEGCGHEGRRRGARAVQGRESSWSSSSRSARTTRSCAGIASS